MVASPGATAHAHGAPAASYTDQPPIARTDLLAMPREWWDEVSHWSALRLLRFLRYVNAALAVLQAIAGFMGLFDLVQLDVTSFLISVYAIIFALLLLAFECRFSSMEPEIRQQCGFLFTYRGRTAFIFCVGFMDFGMNSSLGWFVGFCMCLDAAFNWFVMLFHPEFRNGHLSSMMDPTATYCDPTEETAQLLSQHPEYTAKAGAYVAQQALQNPQAGAYVAQQALQNPQAGAYVAQQVLQNPQYAVPVAQAFVAQHPQHPQPPAAAQGYVPPQPTYANHHH